MLINTKYISSLIKHLVFLVLISISIFLVFCDSNNNQYTGPWKEVPTPGGQGHLNACYFTSPDNGWACGEEGDGPYPILIHWNGTDWEEYPYGGWFDNVNFTNVDLENISFSGPNDGWCVGRISIKDESRTHGVILRYDGNQWYLFKDQFEESIHKVFCINSNDVWFDIYEINDGDVLYHWDGVDIKKSDTSPVNAGIEALAFSSSNEGLAVGWYYCVYHWDGTSWTEIGIDPSRPYVNNAVSYYESNSALIAGDERRARWRNGIYQYEYCWNYGYEDIHFSHPDEGWMIGCGPDPSDPLGYGGYIWQWDGTNWIKMKVPPNMVDNAVFSIDYDIAWIVGQNEGNCASWMYVPK